MVPQPGIYEQDPLSGLPCLSVCPFVCLAAMANRQLDFMGKLDFHGNVHEKWRPFVLTIVNHRVGSSLTSCSSSSCMNRGMHQQGWLTQMVNTINNLSETTLRLRYHETFVLRLGYTSKPFIQKCLKKMSAGNAGRPMHNGNGPYRQGRLLQK
jgi:hypothetical protein